MSNLSSKKEVFKQKKIADATEKSLYRIFTVPEAPDSTLGQIDQRISQNLIGFLQDHIVATEKEPEELEKDFVNATIPETPIFVSEQTDFLMEKVVAQSVHTSSPSFIGHMTSALPYFMLPLSRIMLALNQNLVKIETSKAFTPLERQVIGMLHRLIYSQQDAFYQTSMHDPTTALGVLCSGGTIANLTALWVARNMVLGAKGSFSGVNQAGMFAALNYHGYRGAVVLVSDRGHYSISKSADILGLGRENIIAIPTDHRYRIKCDLLKAKMHALQAEGVAIISLVGVAGSSETGSVDNLDALADLAEEYGCPYHVDAAWGGPTLFSDKYGQLLKGIERADSVTIDAHKQLYVPMGAGFTLFKHAAALNEIEHHADYIIRKGSRDLGSHTLEGSRPGMAMLVHSGLRIMGRQGYALLVDRGIERAKEFAELIKTHPDFELISEPELNILTYRYVPSDLQNFLLNSVADLETQAALNVKLNSVTKHIQKTQRDRGISFVSRTKLTCEKYPEQSITVFRVVLANPLTTRKILKQILVEQEKIAIEPAGNELLKQILDLCNQ